MERAKSKDVSAPMINRLILTSEKIDQLSQDVEKIAQMPDPLNQTLENWTNPSNGLQFSKVSVPIGVIGIIYESRPNVTIFRQPYRIASTAESRPVFYVCAGCRRLDDGSYAETYTMYEHANQNKMCLVGS